MPENFALYLLLVVALGIGYLLGRWERTRRRTPTASIGRDYFHGLNRLLNERQDQAIDTFIEAIALDSDTVDTQLALGSLVRRRGEVDQAIHIHQNLLARPALSASHRTQIELELARDYMAAGLLDRAESLLLELVESDTDAKHAGLEMLVEIYQRESDWARAAEMGQRLMRRDKSVRRKLAHFQCELAQAALAEGDLRLARELLAKGADADPSCARVNLIAAQVELSAKRYREVKRRLKQVRAQDPELVGETLDLYRQACAVQADEADYREYLNACLADAPVPRVVEVLADYLEREQDAQKARRFVIDQLSCLPSLGGFVMLLDRLQRDGEALQMEELASLRRYAQSLLSEQSSYRCNECGYSGHSLLWMCPSCRNWGSVKPIVNRAAD